YGEYVCTASNLYSFKSKNIILKNPNRHSLNIHVHGDIQPGNKVELTCINTQNKLTTHNAIWLRRDRSISSHTIIDGNNLIIYPFDVNDLGLYTCETLETSDNDIKQQQTIRFSNDYSYSIVKDTDPPHPYIYAQLEPHHVGETLALIAVVAEKAHVYNWSRRSNAEFDYTRTIVNDSYLLINDIQESDADEYVVQVENNYGIGWQNYILHLSSLLPASSNSTDETSVRGQINPNISLTIKIDINGNKKNGARTIKCSTTIRDAFVYWRRRLRESPPVSSLTIENDTLIIMNDINTNSDIDGTYTCFVLNEGMVGIQSIIIDTDGRVYTKADKKISSNGKLVLRELSGSTFRRFELDCVVDDDNALITYKFNGDRIADDVEQQGPLLIINQPESHHFGLYTCLATFHNQTIEESVNVDDFTASDTSVETPFIIIYSPKHQNHSLYICTIDPESDYEIWWVRRLKILNSDTYVKKGQLIFETLTNDTYGEYTCTVNTTNEVLSKTIIIDEMGFRIKYDVENLNLNLTTGFYYLNETTVLLDCLTDDKSYVNWYTPSNGLIKSSKKYSMISASQVLISNINENDLGKYRCQASVYDADKNEVIVRSKDLIIDKVGI
ncbi:unnamed protein product, partial [Didymodactylos carnosus]